MAKKNVDLENTQLFVDIDNARFSEQRQVMQQIISDGTCPFCTDSLAKYHHHPIIKKGKYWLLTENQWPYDYTKVHLLAIFNTHVESLRELPAAAGAELFQLIKWAEKKYNAPGGGIAMRFGDTNYSAGTVAHLHVQFVVPNWEDPNFEPVKIKIGKRKQKVE